MNHTRYRTVFLKCIVVTCIIFSACKSKKVEAPLFEVLNSKSTGLDFTNSLTSTDSFNVFDYMYFYNGAGVGAGDFNNDGKIDLFFASNQGSNKLYLNKGDLKFADVTTAAKIPDDGGWSTGISVVDINNDGLMDIYVCRVGSYKTLNSRNQLLICQGIDKNGVPSYSDKAGEYGLDFSGFSTQAVFFDYDGDGDLDMYLLNHFIHQNGNFGIRQQLLAKSTPLSGDRIYRNDGNKFTDVTKLTGINSSVLGYGLGIVVADINLDGYPDIYIGNDFHENDYLYINQKNGTFKEDLNKHMMHTSQYSMGVDVADINNDAFPEVISMDMLPSDPYILKRSLGEDAYDLFYQKIGYGYNFQYTRNNLQFNRKNEMFSEAGLYSGIASTDWSWAPLWLDFDNDGLKDLFISNGIPKRMNDIDYISYISNQDVQEMIRNNKVAKTNMKLIDKFPKIKIPNKFFRNTGNLVFSDLESQIQNDQATYSNGAVYADFDNDGDLDIVVNNIEDPALVYKNTSNDKKSESYLEIKLKGPANNINALGAKVLVFAKNGIRTYEKYPVRGFLSSMEEPVHIGLDKSNIDSMFVVWPDNSFEPIHKSQGSFSVLIKYTTGLPKFDYNMLKGQYQNPSKPMINITAQTNLLNNHTENAFSEFDREPLIPHMFSTEGPGLAVADINHDGLDDLFIGSSKGTRCGGIFLQNATGAFSRTLQPALDKDSMYEDVDACWVDVNNDGHPDLVVASGGNEYYGPDQHLTPRVYLNDGKANFIKLDSAFGSIYLTASCVVPYDFNADGYTDLFIGGRVVPWDYGQVPRSYLFQNNGHGKFEDVTEKYASDLSYAGFVTQALWFDLDKDGDKDLIICCEWGGIDAFINEKGKLAKRTLTDKKGWWNFVVPCDINNDGNIDLIAGNLGLNSRLKASASEPVKLYYYDFDGNGKKEQVLTYYLYGKQIPFATKSELERQMPLLRKKFLYAEDFAKASLEEIFSSEKLNNATVLTADYFSNALLINRGNLKFEIHALPWEAQLSPLRDAVVVNANNDNLPDIMTFGNYYENNIEMGRYDADFGTMLLNKGKDSFSCSTLNGLQITGQVRHVKKITLAKNQEAFILARNNDSMMVIRFKER